MYPQSIIALDVVRGGINSDDIVKGPVAKLEIGARVWKRSKANDRVGVKNRSMFNVVRVCKNHKIGALFKI
jgi:hypothetical protein